METNTSNLIVDRDKLNELKENIVKETIVTSKGFLVIFHGFSAWLKEFINQTPNCFPLSQSQK